MSTLKRILVAILTTFTLVVMVAGCSSTPSSPAKEVNQQGRESVQKTNESLKPPVVKNFTEYKNYMAAQSLYDDPSSIIWCTTTWGNASAPLVTVPVAGKLTSSSVSLFPSQQTLIDGDTGGRMYNPELPSVDGMFHGSPPAYRYGFTPGGQYVDFSGMPAFCTTALSKFQRQSTQVSLKIDPAMENAQKAAEKALATCNKGDKSSTTEKCSAAQDALEAGIGAK